MQTISEITRKRRGKVRLMIIFFFSGTWLLLASADVFFNTGYFLIFKEPESSHDFQIFFAVLLAIGGIPALIRAIFFFFELRKPDPALADSKNPAER